MREEKSTQISSTSILNKIFIIREHKVMFDKDLALLYGVSTSYLNKAVKRNVKRFPDDFMFQLTQAESENLMFQIGTSRWGGTRKLPYVFTEQGIAMLSGVLNSDRAINVNIDIMRTFIKIRIAIQENARVLLELEKVKAHLKNHDKSIVIIYKYLDKLITKTDSDIKREKIGYKISKSVNKD